MIFSFGVAISDSSAPHFQRSLLVREMRYAHSLRTLREPQSLAGFAELTVPIALIPLILGKVVVNACLSSDLFRRSGRSLLSPLRAASSVSAAAAVLLFG